MIHSWSQESWNEPPPLHCVVFYTLFSLSMRRHLNELKINFVLVALASLRMEMMMDNNDATTGSPSRRCNADDKSTACSILGSDSDSLALNESPRCTYIAGELRGNQKSKSDTNWNWASASLNWFVCDLRSAQLVSIAWESPSPSALCRREKQNSFCFNICLNISKMPTKWAVASVYGQLGDLSLS